MIVKFTSQMKLLLERELREDSVATVLRTCAIGDVRHHVELSSRIAECGLQRVETMQCRCSRVFSTRKPRSSMLF